MTHNENNNSDQFNHMNENEESSSRAEHPSTESLATANEDMMTETSAGQDKQTDHEQAIFSEENDSLHASQETAESNKSKTDSKKRRWKKKDLGIGAVIGGLSGGLIAALTVLILLSNNMIPTGETGETQTHSSEPSQSDEVVSTNVSDDEPIDFSVDDATKAVVGVSRLQQTNIWEPSQEAGTGSGIIYKKEGDKTYIVTNHHVVDGAEEVQVTLSNDEKLSAKVLGSDELVDLAVLEVDGSHIDTVAKLGSSENIQAGETVIAIGNPLGLEFSNSLTRGIISGLNRSVPVDTNGDNQPDWVTEVIQTDAAINPGNSGGALVNADGEVIGINSMKVAQHAVEGIGFAIPIDTAIPIMEQLETDGKVARPYIGVSTAAIEAVPMPYRQNIVLPEDFEGGIVVANVEQGSPADKAGLRQYDIIATLNGEKIESFLDLRKYLYNEANVDETVEIEFYRDGKKQTSELQLTERAIE